MLSQDLIEFFESGVSMQVGTRDAVLFPEDVRAFGCRVDGADALTVFVPEATGERTVANLRDNGRIAICWSRPCDHRTIQVKGSLRSLRRATARDRAIVDRYRSSLARTFGAVGVPTRLTMRLAHWPCHAVAVRVESVFVQTPGPGAGDPLAPRPQESTR